MSNVLAVYSWIIAVDFLAVRMCTLILKYFYKLINYALIGWCIVGKSVGSVQNLSGKMDTCTPRKTLFCIMKLKYVFCKSVLKHVCNLVIVKWWQLSWKHKHDKDVHKKVLCDWEIMRSELKMANLWTRSGTYGHIETVVSSTWFSPDGYKYKEFFSKIYTYFNFAMSETCDATKTWLIGL